MKTSHHKSLLICVFVYLIFLLTLSCKDTGEHDNHNETNYSITQRYLFKLLDDYKSEYTSQQQPEQQSNIREKYLKRLEHFLADSLGRYIDSMTVTVDTVIQKGWMVTTQFHTREIEFKYGMVFKDSMDSKNDSLYRFMKELKPNQEVTVNFIHLGYVELNQPKDKSVRTIRIFAYPSPLNF